jgi:hypothetical protein
MRLAMGKKTIGERGRGEGLASAGGHPHEGAGPVAAERPAAETGPVSDWQLSICDGEKSTLQLSVDRPVEIDLRPRAIRRQAARKQDKDLEREFLGRWISSLIGPWWRA